jgi:antitoxin component YwqK of YwqJK toxin-antitoxin module
MVKDSIFEQSYELKTDLPDGYYIIMDDYGGHLNFKRQEFQLNDSKRILDINYYQNIHVMLSNETDTFSGYSFDDDPKYHLQPPIERKYEFNGGIEKYTEFYESGMLESVEILNINLKNQPLISERWHYKNGGLQLILEKKEGSDLYWIQYYYETGELSITGQFDEFNRPDGIWTFYHENGRKKREGPVCTECVNKLWRPWINTFEVKGVGDWTYYSKDGKIISLEEYKKNER